MRFFHNALRLIADHSRWALIAGLVIGILVPVLADSVRPWVGYWIAVLLFLAALRIDPGEVAGTLQDYKHAGIFILVFQVLIPCLVAWFFIETNITGPIAVALLIVFASAPISGSPGLTMITGNNPAPTLRLLIATTALLPLTVFLPFSLMPVIGDMREVSWIAFRLFLIIFAASFLAFTVRRLLMPDPSPDALKSIDGLTAVAMGMVVIGLMTGFGEAAINRPTEILLILVVAFTVCLGMQVLVWFLVKPFGLGDSRIAFAICSGNKNMAIFLVALPAAVTDPILLFIACYQIPMYLTPTLLGKMYSNHKASTSG
ncbi:MAG: hypothetical protein AAGA76_02110 [Pseudomonadota bacterium]